MEGLRVPFDVLGLIIDELASDIETLKACSLTCRDLLPTARRQIFAKITFLNGPQWGVDVEKRTRQFNQLLDQSPEIATYVISMAYRIQASDPTDPEIQRLLPRLSMLRYLFLNPAASTTDFSTIPNNHISVIHSLLRLPSLVSLKMVSFKNFPVALLASIPQLRKFTFYRMEFIQADSMIYKPIPSTSSPLTEIDTDCISKHDTVEPLFRGTYECPPAFDVKNLQQFRTLVKTMIDIRNINSIFYLACRSLTHVSLLDIVLTGCAFSLAGLHLQELQNLKLFHIEFWVQSDCEDSLQGLADILRTGGQPYHHLEYISIHLTLPNAGLYETSFNTLPALDSTLTVSTQFPSLKAIFLAIDTSDQGPTLNQLKELKTSHFPLLSKSDANVKFEFQVQSGFSGFYGNADWVSIFSRIIYM